ncbi:MAG: hypothetical protein GYA55_08590 [SAR324 cluster bacterium]|uniref:Fibronectin type-III domain-containing protein n=1 Tax=SAR324 cluster bacterium TaxID=2024889 RepID=A0A7X9FSR1_9DELT|nr:hypothetical protein [SAR324 cluster bacterium]
MGINNILKPFRVICFGFFLSLSLLSIPRTLKAESVSLSWDLPTKNTDGTELTDLAGIKLYHGRSSGNYTGIIDLGPVSKTTFNGLEVGVDYYFAVTAYDASGNESVFSNEVHMKIESKNTPTPIPTTIINTPITPTTPTITPIATPTKEGRRTPYPHTGISIGAKMDFDGDMISDIASFETTDSKAIFHIYRSSDQALIDAEFETTNAAVQASGDYNGDGKWDVGIVTRNEKGEFVWIARDSETNADVLRETFGGSSALALSGCDIDGDGKSDLISIAKDAVRMRKSKGMKSAKAKLSGLKVKDANCIDINNDGKDEVSLLVNKKVPAKSGSKAADTRIIVLTQNGQVYLEKTVPAAKALIVADSNANKKDELGYISTKKGKLILNMITKNRTLKFALGAVSDLSAAGYLPISSKQRVAVLYKNTDGAINLYNLKTKRAAEVDIELPDGQLVRPVNARTPSLLVAMNTK